MILESPILMALSHFTGTGPGQIQGMGSRAKGPTILYRNDQTGLRQAQKLDLLSNFVPTPFPVPVLVLFQCSVDVWVCIHIMKILTPDCRGQAKGRSDAFANM